MLELAVSLICRIPRTDKEAPLGTLVILAQKLNETYMELSPGISVPDIQISPRFFRI
jgi:hypothetical protein